MRKIGLVLVTLAALAFTVLPVTTQPARADGGVILAAVAVVWLVGCAGHHHKKGKRHHHHGWCWH